MATLPTANSDLTEEEQPILSSRPQSSRPQLTAASSSDSSVEAERLEAEQVHLLYARSWSQQIDHFLRRAREYGLLPFHNNGPLHQHGMLQ
jgi:hypothetical protein